MKHKNKTEQTSALDQMMCPKCQGRFFTQCDQKATATLPAVRAWMCVKCGAKFWHKADSLAYQRAKENLERGQSAQAKEGNND